MNTGWGDTYLGLIFQVYGLAFFVLGVIALLSMRRDSARALSAHLGWLAAFGMLHGLRVLIDVERLHNPASWLVLLGTALMVASFAALLEFGRRLWNERSGTRRLAALPLFAVAVAGTMVLMLTAPAAAAGLELAARYLLGAPGASLSGIGLLAQARAAASTLETAVTSRWLRLAAFAMLGYAALTLFLSPGAGRLLADWMPTTVDFLAITGLPVQLARALCAVLLAVCFIVIARQSASLVASSLQRVTDRLNGFVYCCRNDQRWTVSFMSGGGETLTGYPTADFLQGKRHFAELIHPDDQDRVWSEVQAALSERQDFRLQYRMIDRNGSVRWCYEEGCGVFDTQGELLYLEGLVRNDDARHQADEARRRMQALVEASPQAMGWADPDGTVRYFNNALRTLMGVSADEDITGYQLRNFYEDQAYVKIESTVLPTVIEQGSWVGEIALTDLSGRSIPTLNSVFALRDDMGEMVAFANVITDLSAVRAAERELRIKDAAIAASTSAIALAGPDGMLTYVNQAFVALWGLTGPEEAIGRSVLTFWEQPDLAQAVVDALFHAGHWQGELRGMLSDGDQVDVQLSASMVLDHDGKPLCMMGSFLDVTARNQSRQALQQERDFAQSLLDTAPAIILLLDPKGMIRHVNPWFEQLTGYRRDEVVGKEWFSTFLPPRDQARIRAIFKSALLDQPVRGNINPIVIRSGEERAIEWHAMTLRDAGGQMTGLLSIGMDVTERQRLENKLHELNQSLEQRVEKRTRELEKANAAKSEFLSRMSHELRTPLNAILGFTQLLQLSDADAFTSQQADHVQEIAAAGEHLLALVNDILDLARIESGQLALSPEPLALAPLLERCVAQIAPLARERGIKPELIIQQLCMVMADATRLKQVVLNLLSNAVKYNAEGGNLQVESMVVDHQRVRIQVRDSGQGISDEQQARLFQPFERLESAYHGIEGTGIGLALAKQLVEGMQGRIGVSSEPGKGSCFWFELPVCQAAARAAAENESVAPEQEAVVKVASSTLSQEPSHTLVYIEDNPANLRLVQKILARHSEYRLLTADNGQQGIALALQAQPELILLDINMPGMDGFAVLEQLQADPQTRHVPVIALSANAMQRDIERATQAGFTDYITKPIQVPALLQSIAHSLQSKPQPPDGEDPV